MIGENFSRHALCAILANSKFVFPRYGHTPLANTTKVYSTTTIAPSHLGPIYRPSPPTTSHSPASRRRTPGKSIVNLHDLAVVRWLATNPVHKNARNAHFGHGRRTILKAARQMSRLGHSSEEFAETVRRNEGKPP